MVGRLEVGFSGTSPQPPIVGRRVSAYTSGEGVRVEVKLVRFCVCSLFVEYEESMWSFCVGGGYA